MDDSTELNDSAQICSICLDTITIEKRCVAKDCMHQFCHGCLQQWLNVRSLCPLCKVAIESVMYNIKTDTDYEEQFIDHDGYNSSDNDTPPYDDDEYDDDIEIDNSSAASSYDMDDFNFIEVVNNGVTEYSVQIQTLNNVSSEDGGESGSDDIIELSDSDTEYSSRSSASIRSSDIDF